MRHGDNRGSGSGAVVLLLVQALVLLLQSQGALATGDGAWRPEASDGTQCLGSAGSSGHSPTCLPGWKPTWDMKRSTVLYTCNNTGMHDVSHALEYGTVVYDWSNAKLLGQRPPDAIAGVS